MLNIKKAVKGARKFVKGIREKAEIMEIAEKIQDVYDLCDDACISLARALYKGYLNPQHIQRILIQNGYDVKLHSFFSLEEGEKDGVLVVKNSIYESNPIAKLMFKDGLVTVF